MASSESVVLGGGCFWCLEAVFQRIKGIKKVENGYAGGETEYPTYEAVCSGITGHAEVVRINFNPQEISLETIFKIFWTIHNPTTLNRQGNDVGTQYRSVIFYQDDSQKIAAEDSLQKVGQPLWDQPIVTKIVPLEKFYPAERYHQNYFNTNPEQAYCQIIINPKVLKLKQKFARLLK